MPSPSRQDASENTKHETRRRLLIALGALHMMLALPAIAGSPRPKALPLPDGGEEAREDFDKGIRMLLGGEGVEPGTLDLGNGLTLEIATDACALGPDPAGYISDYNTAMKERILEMYGVDVDLVLLNAAP